MRKLPLAAGVVAGLAGLKVRRAVEELLIDVAPEFRSPAVVIYQALPHDPRFLGVRRRFQARVKGRVGAHVEVSDHVVPAVPSVSVRVTRPDRSVSSAPALLVPHGGGMISGTHFAEGYMHGGIVRELGAVVVSPDYRLAPEHQFPAALDDCMAALQWMREKAGELGIDRERIGVLGASAGGNLAAAVAQRAHDEGAGVRVQVLIYPMIDDRTGLSAAHGNRGKIWWRSSQNLYAWTAYLGRAPRPEGAPAYAAPARRTDLTGLPPAWVGVGDLDLFYDECVDYAARLEAAGVSCELATVPGMFHGADVLAENSASVQEFRRSMLDFLREYL